jgi:hypothetical protein
MGRGIVFVVSLCGGLGNQLFQYAFALGLRERFPDREIVLDVSSYENIRCHNGFELEKQKDFPVIKKLPRRDFVKISDGALDYSRLGEDVWFSGYWQSTRYLSEAVRKRLSAFLFETYTFSDENLALVQQIGSCQSVSLHVRRGDYVDNPLHGNIANKEYFNNAVAEVVRTHKAPEFFVFSEDRVWCAENIFFGGHPVSFVNWNAGELAAYDLLLMSLCKTNIISNSSFSWWAQYLNPNEDKRLIVPPYWYNETAEAGAVDLPSSVLVVQNIRLRRDKAVSPFVSVVISVGAATPSLRRCLVSVLNQRLESLEVICVDDSADEGNRAVMREYATFDPRVTVIHGDKTLGKAQAVLDVIPRARGMYLHILDPQDWLDLEAYRQAQEAASGKDYGVIGLAIRAYPRAAFRQSSGERCRYLRRLCRRLCAQHSVEGVLGVKAVLIRKDILAQGVRAVNEIDIVSLPASGLFIKGSESNRASLLGQIGKKILRRIR